jgi:hypothetical protein
MGTPLPPFVLGKVLDSGTLDEGLFQSLDSRYFIGKVFILWLCRCFELLFD